MEILIGVIGILLSSVGVRVAYLQLKRTPEIEEVNRQESTTIYESRYEAPPFKSWTTYCNAFGKMQQIRIVRRAADGLATFILTAFSSEEVGVNKFLSKAVLLAETSLKKKQGWRMKKA